MAINNSYIRPQSEVYQLLATTISQTNGHGAACVVGSQYDVYKYEDGSATASDNTGSITLSYAEDETGMITHTVDEDSVQVYLKDVFASIKPDIEVTLEDEQYTILTAPENSYWAAEYTQDVTLVCENYSVSLGDVVKTSTASARVVALIPSEDNPKVYDKIKVSSNLYDLSTSKATVTVGKLYSGLTPATVTVTEGVASYDAGATITVKGKGGADVTCTLTANTGEAYAEFRVRVTYATDANDGLLRLSTVQDIQDNLGTIDIQNELAYACYRAISGSQGREVYAIRVTDDTPEAFLDAMYKTESNTNVYAFVPVTGKTECMDTVVEFNNSMSTPTVKKWRITFVGADIKNASKVTVDGAGKELKADLHIVEGTTKKYMCTLSEDNVKEGLLFTDFAVGDKVILTVSATESSTSYEFVINAIKAENLAVLTALNTVPTSAQTGASVTIERTDSVQGNIAYASQLASKFNSRRTVVVWCDNGRSDGKVINNAYIAAEVAGLTSAVQPQQGLTHTEITTVESAPRMYTRYTQGQLDTIAAHGVLIVTQDTADTTPYIRHQLTTSPDKGILYSELSCTRNIDNISYAVADLIASYVGRVNITPEALATIRRQLDTLWSSFTTNSTSDLIGPSLVSYDGVRLEQDPVALDRIIVNVNYYIPSPLNRISVYQMAYVATVTLNSIN